VARFCASRRRATHLLEVMVALIAGRDLGARDLELGLQRLRAAAFVVKLDFEAVEPAAHRGVAGRGGHARGARLGAKMVLVACFFVFGEAGGLRDGLGSIVSETNESVWHR
jgi:hypothetical protein